MPIALQFLDGSQPALPQAARWLADAHGEAGRLDLQQLIVAVPGKQVGRRLLELLVAEAEAWQALLIPPHIVTAGRLPEKLYEPKKPFATDLTQQLAWVQVLKAMDAGRLEPLVRELPAADDLPGWLTLGQMLAKLHQELAADGVDCADILKHAAELEAFNETDRWRLLDELERAYLAKLDSLNLWDMQTARLFAIKHKECRANQQIVLVGMVDLNRSQRDMLDQVAEHVTALVFAPPNSAKRFDSHGCLAEAEWQNVPLGLAAEQIEIVGGPADQADAAVRGLAALGGKYAADEITIGVPDARLVPYLRQRLEEAGLPVRYGMGTELVRTGPHQLLSEAADYLDRRRFRDLAALARHPALSRWLLRQKIKSDWLSLLDKYYSEHLPAELPSGRGKSDGDVRQIQGAVASLLSSLRGKARPLSEWSKPILDLLADVFGGETLDENIEADRVVIAACEAIKNSLKDYGEIPKQLSPNVTSSEALRLVLGVVASATIAPRSDGAAIELRGWLELPWDDAPAMIVTGFNEGIVPASGGRDLFLPDALRRRLKLDDHARRYARDAYALSLLASRPDLRIIAGRRTADGDPLIPSRLLLACEDAELPRRTRSLLIPPPAKPRMRLVGGVHPGQADASRLPVPPPPGTPIEVTSLTVTEFRDYIACPYRYYLRHRLDLRLLDDSAAELDGAGFGNLLHDVLRDFGRGGAADEASADAIRNELVVTLGQLAAERFGEKPLPAVRVQLEMLKMRLEEFAVRQAAWRGEGWKIETAYIERKFVDGEAALPADGLPLYLRGRIDRIDRNERTGQIVVLDYKSGDSPKPPDAVHRRGPRGDKEWVDLQLPLYRHLVRALGLAEPVQLGYVLLPKQIDKTGFELAAWTPDELAEADELARSVVQGVRGGKFWPPADRAPANFPEFSAICRDDVFAAAVAAAQAFDGEEDGQ